MSDTVYKSSMIRINFLNIFSIIQIVIVLNNFVKFFKIIVEEQQYFNG